MQTAQPSATGLRLSLLVSSAQESRLLHMAGRMGLSARELAQRILDAGCAGYLTTREPQWDVTDYSLTSALLAVRRVRRRSYETEAEAEARVRGA